MDTCTMCYVALFLYVLYLNFWPLTRKSVAGKNILITGGGSGIGRGMCKKFASLGANLIVLDLRKDLADETAAEVAKVAPNVKVSTYVCDVSNREMIYKVAEEVKAALPKGQKVDMLINNAGIVSGKWFMEIPDSSIQRTMDVNIMAHFWMAKAYLQPMMDANDGHIVSIASAAGHGGTPMLTDYCASKFAAVGFEEAMRYELKRLGKTGVHSTVVNPYFINTGMFDGAKTSPYFKYVLPILEPDYVVDKIVDAVRSNTEVLMMPRLIYLSSFLRFVLTPEMLRGVTYVLGLSRSMDDFKGRGDEWASKKIK
eukprot:GFYU01001008.1.p1 GENE.GFYU01001008.1~~GFYU01001008.1.p1  ORF type:complete len:312 (+),score=114.00 GFYU01001008.1:114-1049(+)